jgi:xylan 1,4-beta-xylosidase
VPNPHNPILTHRDRPEHPIQALGHADLVETPDGWWMVALGIRPQGGEFHHLGRETFLAPVTWSEDDWPVVNKIGAIELAMPAPRLPQQFWEQESPRDLFDEASLGLQWNYLRNPYEKDYSLVERPGYLRLKGSAITLNDQDSPAFVGRRQTDLKCRASTQLSFDARHEDEEAGLVLRGNEKNHFEIGVTRRGGKRQVFFRQVMDGKALTPVRFENAGSGDVILTVEAAPTTYEFFYQTLNGSRKQLGSALTRDLSSEKVGGFTGVYIGLYATGNGQTSLTPADFDWFEYVAAEP